MSKKRKCYKTPQLSFEARTMWEPNSGCLLWLGCTNHAGYGCINNGKKMVRAHRFAWEQDNGPIPDGICVLHRCDIRSCCNSKHLFLGTQLDNIDDMCAKSRQYSKLTETDICSIRSDNRILRIIAKDYGVGISLISRIKNNKLWKHL